MDSSLHSLRVCLLVGIVVFGGHLPPSSCSEKVCRGTSNGVSHQGTAEHRYQSLKNIYTNCTVVNGNLEIVFLDEAPNYDLSFLSQIREVKGYMLYVSVNADVLPMYNLRIIRGRTLFSSLPWNNTVRQKQYSLFIVNNHVLNSKTIGLKKLLFTSLREILEGDVTLQSNKLLCNDDTILWHDIVVGEHRVVELDEPSPQAQCQPCHESCEEFENRRYCWGPQKNECQILTRNICSQQCESRCFGTGPSECCHPECAGGCTGPRKQDCWACQHFRNDDSCVPFCPPQQIYDDKEFRLVTNPNAKFTFGNICVEKCPSYLVEESGACVKECGAGKFAQNRTCIECDGPCPKTCTGYHDPNDYLTYEDLENFRGCTIINGNLQILAVTLNGEEEYNVPGVHPTNLSVFNEVREITGYLSIQGTHPEFTNADFLANLEIIDGRTLFERKFALSIVQTNFQSLGLIKLRLIKNGDLLFFNNADLCYLENTNFQKLLVESEQKVRMRANRPEDQCRTNNFVCDSECSEDGCWGLGNKQCLSCRNFQFKDQCIGTCKTEENLYSTENKTCHRCDPECADTCRGPGSNNCNRCKNVQDGPYCYSQCPAMKYPDENNVCQKCHEFCADGCTGPRNMIGEGGCNSCDLIQVDENFKIEKCLEPESICLPGFYRGQMPLKSPQAGIPTCKRCDPLCRTCHGPGTAHCIECSLYKQDGACVNMCHLDTYVDQEEAECIKCHVLCEGCTGPGSTSCKACRRYKVYLESPADESTPLEGIPEKPRFNCTEACPPEMQYVQEVEIIGGYEKVCTSEALTGAAFQETNRFPFIIGGAVAVFIILCVGFLGACYLWRKREQSKENTMKFAARFSGLEEGEPLTPSNASPDMAVLRLIKESELRRGNIIGSGAFGTVYKGMWVPENENVKIPVAIKVLQESTSPSQNKELLDEARVMFSVQHQYCVRILAVCMTAQMMLITQLMPLGCLLEYVRKNRSNIGSKVLLNWCKQIARGMAYLEDRAIVHRDLAARNVLVHSPSVIKITDFGLAKLLDFNEDEYRSSGGKMPIKWLALECIQHRIFTHKSDVWSYGVTVWELFTYGQRPYDNIRARDVPELLEKGERLPQPSICTIDVYMIMIKCWMLDAESRPNFRELAEEFSKMARDPGRYLVIHGDALMRLPSHSIDKRELVRSMSVSEEGPEEIVDAEDYLQPTATPQKSSEYDNEREDSPDCAVAPPGCSVSYQPSKNNIKFHQNGHYPPSSKGEAASPRDSVSSRYSPDPCQILGDPKDAHHPAMDIPHNLPPPVEEEEMEDDVPDTKPQKMPLPIIDEDDYLTPKSSHPAPYMDLIDGKDYLDPVPNSDGAYLEPTSPGAMDNPEYFNTPDLDVGIEGLKKPKGMLPPPYTPHNELPPSQTGEYYNDFDKPKARNGISPKSPTESIV